VVQYSTRNTGEWLPLAFSGETRCRLHAEHSELPELPEHSEHILSFPSHPAMPTGLVKFLEPPTPPDDTEKTCFKIRPQLKALTFIFFFLFFF